MTQFVIANLGDAALSIPSSTVNAGGTLSTGGFIWVNNTTGNSILLTLTAALTPFIIIKDIAGNAGVHSITITYAGGIDGGTTATLTEPYQSVFLGWNGSAYYNGSVNLGISNNNPGTFQGITVNSQGLVTGAVTATTTLTGDITGSGSSSISTTLPTVNSNVGTFQGITVNAKGQVTAAVAQSKATLQTPLLNPSATSSTTQVMLGLGGSGPAVITPRVTGNIHFTVTGAIACNAASYVAARAGTGTAPVNGAAAIGAQYGGLIQSTTNATVSQVPFSVSGMIIGAALNTALWLDVSFQTSNGADAVTILQAAVCAAEI